MEENGPCTAVKVILYNFIHGKNNSVTGKDLFNFPTNKYLFLFYRILLDLCCFQPLNHQAKFVADDMLFLSSIIFQWK